MWIHQTKQLPDRTFAKAISYILSPLIFPPLLFGIVLAAGDVAMAEAVWVLGIVLLFGSLIPLAVALREVRLGRSASINLSHVAERWKPYVAAGIGFAGVALIIAIIGPPLMRLLVALSITYAINSLLIVFAAIRWMPSVHAASVAGVLSILVFLHRAPVNVAPAARYETPLLQEMPTLVIIIMLLLMTLVAWSRLRVGAHTLSEVAMGTVFGLFLPYTELLFASRMNWL